MKIDSVATFDQLESMTAEIQRAIAALQPCRLSQETWSGPVIIFAGHGGDAARFPGQFALLREVLGDLTGTLLAGGTDTGLPGMLGAISRELVAEARKGFYLVGYLPEAKLKCSGDPSGYDRLVGTVLSDEFSNIEPIQMWVDLLSMGIPAEQVHLVGINGGPIAAFEYKLALMLGARVGLIQGSGRSADKILEVFSDHPCLTSLPKNPAALLTFLGYQSAFDPSVENT